MYFTTSLVSCFIFKLIYYYVFNFKILKLFNALILNFQIKLIYSINKYISCHNIFNPIRVCITIDKVSKYDGKKNNSHLRKNIIYILIQCAYKKNILQWFTFMYGKISTTQAYITICLDSESEVSRETRALRFPNLWRQNRIERSWLNFFFRSNEDDTPGCLQSSS